MTLICVHSPETESELAMTVAILEAHDILCFVHNRHFGSLFPGVQINAYNTQSVMVPDECVPEAVEALLEFRAAAPVTHVAHVMTSYNKLRILIEELIFGWFVPGNRTRKDT